jgi:glycine/D-amino acid oxidase-like deaminating enzyme
MSSAFDAIIVGGGFYGCVIAIYLSRTRGLKNVLLVEQAPALMTRASYNNQARVHNGYHYPRSFTTAYRSRINLPRFVTDWSAAVSKDFTKLYAIARRNSKVTALQFERFCAQIGASCKPASAGVCKLFNPHLIEQVFVVDEFAFDAVKLASLAERELREYAVQVRCGTRVAAIANSSAGSIRLDTVTEAGVQDEVRGRYVINCTYSGLNQFRGDFPGTKTELKHEITEMALVAVPPQLEHYGVTVMDGPFFSLMPFPARGEHTLSHVRYTPHLNWRDDPGIDPYGKLNTYERASRGDRMIRDAARYLPAIADAHQVGSLFEVKTVLVKNEGDDGRPILFERHPGMPGCYSVLGGKIDNIYDVLEKLDAESFSPATGPAHSISEMS